jgi:hypothetical protein
VDALMDWDALMGADNAPELGTDATFPKPGFDFVEVLALQDDPPGVTRSLFGRLMELAPDNQLGRRWGIWGAKKRDTFGCSLCCFTLLNNALTVLK